MSYEEYYESGAYLDEDERPAYYKSDADEMLKEGILTAEEYASAEIIDDSDY